MAANGLMYTFNSGPALLSSGVSATDIFTIGMPAGVKALIHEIRLTSNQTNDARLVVQIARRSSGPTGGTTITPKPVNPRNTVVAAATVTTFPTSVGTLNYAEEAEAWSVLIPYVRLFTNDERDLVDVSTWYSLFLAVPPASPILVAFSCRYEEI